MVTLVKPEHSLKASSPIVVTEFGMVTLVKPEQTEKALSPIVVTEFGMVTLVKPEQTEKAEEPILMTELGMVYFFCSSDIGNLINVVLFLSKSTPSKDEYLEFSVSTINSFKPEQTEKAELAISVTELPIVTLVKPEQP